MYIYIYILIYIYIYSPYQEKRKTEVQNKLISRSHLHIKDYEFYIVEQKEEYYKSQISKIRARNAEQVMIVTENPNIDEDNRLRLIRSLNDGMLREMTFLNKLIEGQLRHKEILGSRYKYFKRRYEKLDNHLSEEYNVPLL